MKWTSLALVLALGSACKEAPKPPPASPPAPTAAAPTPAPAPKPAAPAPDPTDAAFWKWFSEHAAALRADADLQHTMESISAELEKDHPGVFAEIGGDGDGRDLVLSVDGKQDLFPIVQRLYAARPTVAGWRILAFRQRDRGPGMTIEIGGKKLDPAQMKFVAAPGPTKLDVTVFVPGFTTTDELGQGLFIVLDHTVGEYDMETRIGGIEFAAIDQAPPAARPLAELPALIDQSFPKE